MKRLFAVLLSVLLICSLVSCTMGTDGTTLNTETSDATEAPKVDIEKYEKNFSGMISYLKDMEFLSSSKDSKTVMQADIIGAKKGVRYMVDSSNFVEFYAYDTKNLSTQAQEFIDTISKGEIYKLLNITNVKGAVSDSGKYVMIYPASSGYDYTNITKEFKKF